MKGMLHVYTGNGKGKTTAAIGLAVRALGRGWKVFLLQFMKGSTLYGELETLKKLDGITVIQTGRPDLVDKDNPLPVDFEMAQEGLKLSSEAIDSRLYNLVILDEINVAVEWGLITKEEMLKLAKNKPVELELVFTGRYAVPEIIEIADLVTEMKEIKHYYSSGIPCREGVEC